MKNLILFSAFLMSTISYGATPISTLNKGQCLTDAQAWIQPNFTAVLSIDTIRQRVFAFCASGGNAACLLPAQVWFSQNSLDGPDTVRARALNFCSGTDAVPTK